MLETRAGICMLAVIIAVLGFLLGLEHALDNKKVSSIPMIGEKQAETLLSSWSIAYFLYVIIAGLLLLTLQHFLPAPIKPSIGMFMVLGAVALILLLAKRVLQYTQLKYDSERYALLLHLFHGTIATFTFLLILLSAMQAFGQGMLYLTVFALGAFLAVLLVRIMIGMPLRFMKGIAQTVGFVGVSSLLVGFLALM